MKENHNKYYCKTNIIIITISNLLKLKGFVISSKLDNSLSWLFFKFVLIQNQTTFDSRHVFICQDKPFELQAYLFEFGKMYKFKNGKTYSMYSVEESWFPWSVLVCPEINLIRKSKEYLHINTSLLRVTITRSMNEILFRQTQLRQYVTFCVVGTGTLNDSSSGPMPLLASLATIPADAALLS